MRRGCSNPGPDSVLLAVWAWDGVGVEPGREHSGMLGVMWMPRGPTMAQLGIWESTPSLCGPSFSSSKLSSCFVSFLNFGG